MESKVTISLETYNRLRDANTNLVLENKELRDAIEALQDTDGQKVIIRETFTYEDEDGEETAETRTSVKGFDEVKAEVEEFYKQKIKEMEARISEVEKERENACKEVNAVYEQKVKAEIEVSRLKRRNLWKRILNK